MHGNAAYCRKHGHDWKTIDYGLVSEEDEIVFIHVECQRCGLNHLRYAFYAEDDE